MPHYTKFDEQAEWTREAARLGEIKHGLDGYMVVEKNGHSFGEWIQYPMNGGPYGWINKEPESDA